MVFAAELPEPPADAPTPVVFDVELPLPLADAPAPVAFGVVLSVDLVESAGFFSDSLGGAAGAAFPGDAPMGLNS